VRPKAENTKQTEDGYDTPARKIMIQRNVQFPWRTELGTIADSSEPDAVAAGDEPCLARSVADDDGIVAAALQRGSVRRIEVSASDHCAAHRTLTSVYEIGP